MKKEFSVNNVVHKLAFCSGGERLGMFRNIPVNNQGSVLLGVSKRVRRAILERLTAREVVGLLHYVDLDKAAWILRDVNERRRRKVIKELSGEVREKVDFLLRFGSGTAASLMSLDYVEVEANASFGDVLEAVRGHEEETGKVPAVLVVKDGFLIGEVPFYSVGFHRKSQSLSGYIRKVPSVRYDEGEREVLELFRGHPHRRVVVLDKDRSILGVIYSDDILRIIEGKSARSLYGFAGVRNEEDIFDSVGEKVRNRYKWLIVNLGTAFLAAWMVGLFEGTISKFVLLAAYMPVVAGMGGNAAMQTLAVMVRGVALREVDFGTGIRVALNEIVAGIVNGVITGALVVAVAIFWNENPLLGLVAGLSIVVNLIVAGFFGTVVPLVMKKLGKDPADSAAIIISSATDIGGFFVFLSLARIFLV